MSRYDGLIIPRSYNEYINKTDPVAMSQALQLSGVLSGAVAAGDNKAVKSSAVNNALTNYTKSIGFDDTVATSKEELIKNKALVAINKGLQNNCTCTLAGGWYAINFGYSIISRSNERYFVMFHRNTRTSIIGCYNSTIDKVEFTEELTANSESLKSASVIKTITLTSPTGVGYIDFDFSGYTLPSKAEDKIVILSPLINNHSGWSENVTITQAERESINHVYAIYQAALSPKNLTFKVKCTVLYK